MLTDFGKFCRKLRIDHDETQKDIADYLGVTTAYLSTMENGKRNISKTIADKLITRYNLSGVDLDRFILAIDNSMSLIKFHIAKLNFMDRKLIMKIYHNLNKLNDEDKRELIEVIDNQLANKSK